MKKKKAARARRIKPTFQLVKRLDMHQFEIRRVDSTVEHDHNRTSKVSEWHLNCICGWEKKVHNEDHVNDRLLEHKIELLLSVNNIQFKEGF